VFWQTLIGDYGAVSERDLGLIKQARDATTLCAFAAQRAFTPRKVNRGKAAVAFDHNLLWTSADAIVATSATIMKQRQR
jgi:hypothetical protein